MEIRGEVKSLKRSISRRHAVNRHQEFRLRDIDEKIPFSRMILVPSEFHGLAAKRQRLLVLNVTFGTRRSGSCFFQEVANGIERDDLEVLDVLEGLRAAD